MQAMVGVMFGCDSDVSDHEFAPNGFSSASGLAGRATPVFDPKPSSARRS
jgi:hypothetical protein